MGLRFPAQQFGNCFFVTTTFRDWIPYGHVPGFYEVLADSVAFYSEKYKAKVIGYVFMPTHLHMILYLDGSHLGDFMRDFKKYIAQKAARELGVVDKAIWMSRYDRLAITSEMLLSRLQYMHNNPVKAELASRVEDWLWSSAADYGGHRVGHIVVVTDWSTL
ncbi:hypothetical protein C3F09_12050 [candidate division GN15 bacterium]|uniref:Transposase IS200-like domain-containing protein n=1 Tax=candidate division GN15 bacterium TaxID=2072418 RepID=A0A855X389_9BACT|nr:MAG: hypothetical protein C3F09_12050 [candidate division GN15 bacterium]